MSTSTNDEHFRNALYSWPEIGLILLYENFYQKLLRIADMYTRDRQSSEDVLQEVFVDVWRRHKEIGQRRDEHIERYLMKAVQYASIRYYKKRLRTTTFETKYFYSRISPVSEATQAPANEGKDDQRLLKLIAATFPPRERECLLLKMDGYPIAAIAGKLNISAKAAERNLTRARKRFKRFGSRFYDSFL